MDGWSRRWLEDVAASYRALGRERRAQEMRLRRALRVSSPSTGQRSAVGGVADRLAPMDAYVDREAELRSPSSPLRAHEDRLDEFDAAMAVLREGTEDEINEATYAAECRYRLDMGEREAADELGVSRSTIRRRIDTLADYLDYVGPAKVGVRV